jgi:sugar phosphate isomerase/epimerase
VHIKDGVRDPATGEERYFFPDEGVCDVAVIVNDLLASGYDGGLSIEPHMAVVFHDARITCSERARFDNYLEYGRRFERMLAEALRRVGRDGSAPGFPKLCHAGYGQGAPGGRTSKRGYDE